jgi:hypothetical protein
MSATPSVLPYSFWPAKVLPEVDVILETSEQVLVAPEGRDTLHDPVRLHIPYI